jgi:hypothetical protein
MSLFFLLDHYSIDIIIAFYLSYRGWRWYGYLTQNRQLREQEPFIAYLERRSSESDFQYAVNILKQKGILVDQKLQEVKEAFKNRNLVTGNEFQSLQGDPFETSSDASISSSTPVEWKGK